MIKQNLLFYRFVICIVHYQVEREPSGRDPNQPKRPQNPFFQFCKEQRDSVAQQVLAAQGVELRYKNPPTPHKFLILYVNILIEFIKPKQNIKKICDWLLFSYDLQYLIFNLIYMKYTYLNSIIMIFIQLLVRKN